MSDDVAMEHLIRAVIFAVTKEEALEQFWGQRKGHRLRIVRVESTRHWKHTEMKTWDVYYVRGEEDGDGKFQEVHEGYMGKCLWCGGVVLQKRGQGRPGKFCNDSHRTMYQLKGRKPKQKMGPGRPRRK